MRAEFIPAVLNILLSWHKNIRCAKKYVEKWHDNQYRRQTTKVQFTIPLGQQTILPQDNQFDLSFFSLWNKECEKQLNLINNLTSTTGDNNLPKINTLLIQQHSILPAQWKSIRSILNYTAAIIFPVLCLYTAKKI